MAVISRLAVRDSLSTNVNPSQQTLVDLAVAFVVLAFVALLCTLALFMLRRHRKAKATKNSLESKTSRPTSKISNHRRLTVTASPYGRHSKAITIYNEKEIMVDSSSQPNLPSSPVPEIRITFPEEEEEGGKRKSGRVVVVRISENGGVGLEPVNEDHLPPYQKSDAERFHSLDLDRIGGLKEKM